MREYGCLCVPVYILLCTENKFVNGKMVHCRHQSRLKLGLTLSVCMNFFIHIYIYVCFLCVCGVCVRISWPQK